MLVSATEGTLATKIYDIVQVGYGPVSQASALMLARQGRSIAVCERWTTRYPLPRAVCIDHELFRVLAANGMGGVLPAISHPGPPYQWFNAQWKELLVIDWSAPSISGGSEVNFVHQPTLEEALDEAVTQLPTVDLHLGWEAVAIRQDQELAHVDLVNVETGARKTLSAHYVIGCDGANSLVRETIGGGREDRGFEADWLVIDVKLKEGVTIEKLGIPGAGQYCDPLRPTTIVPAGVREGRLFRRWEFMRLPGESNEELERESRVWELLKPWAGPGDIQLVRHKVYNFRSLLAEQWRLGRLLIAGDAAHVMPPFMGQGMCSGFRDAWNLSWKLALVLDGKARDDLLDTYQEERMPHVSQLIDMSIYLGKIICIPDPQAAAERDRAFFGGTAPPPPPFPRMTAGILHRRKDGQPAEGAGLLAPHVDILVNGARRRLDEVVPVGGFSIIARGFDPADAIEPGLLRALAVLRTSYVALGKAAVGRIEDLSGRLDRFLEDQCWAAVIVRPDFYVYGGAADETGLISLVRDMLSDLAHAGVNMTNEYLEQPTEPYVEARTI